MRRDARRRAGSDGWIALAGAVAFGVAAGLWFGGRPGMPVLVGMGTIDAVVPAHYQVSVFPAFGAMGALLAADIVRGVHRDSWLARAALLMSTSALAILRLTGGLPLSGHVLFLTALLAHELASRGRSGHAILWIVAAPALGLTSWYKLVVWQDTTWFAWSLLVGAVLGAGMRWLWRPAATA